MKKIYAILVFLLLNIGVTWGQVTPTPVGEYYVELRTHFWGSYPNNEFIWVYGLASDGTAIWNWSFTAFNRQDYYYNTTYSALQPITKVYISAPGNTTSMYPFSVSSTIPTTAGSWDDSNHAFTLTATIYPKAIVIVANNPNALAPSDNNLFPTDDKITLSASMGFIPICYHWQYSFDQSNWIDFPAALQNSSQVSLSGRDLLGNNVNDMLSYNNIYFRITCPGVYTPIQSIKLVPILSAPHILSTTKVLNKCNGDTGGSIKVNLDRALYSNEKLQVLYVTTNPSGNGSINSQLLDSNNSFTLNNLQGAGNYHIQIAAFNGSADYSDGNNYSADVDLSDPSPVAFSLASSGNVGCYGDNTGSFTVNASGGTPPYTLNYRLQGATTYSQSPFTTTATVNGLIAGSYEYYVSDTNSCVLKNSDGTTQTQSVNITQPAAPLSIASHSHVDASGNGLSNGSISLNASGGTAPYTYLWNNGAITQNLDNVPAGIYWVTVKDANACTTGLKDTISQPPLLITSIENTKKILCHGDLNGELVAHALGGTPRATGTSYTYQWYNTNDLTTSLGTDSVLSDIGTGNYQVIVSDGARIINTTTTTFNLGEPTALASTNSVQDASCFNNNDGFIHVNVTGGTPPYTLNYKLSTDNHYTTLTSSTPFAINNLIAGDYQLYGMDADNCTIPISGNSLATITIHQPTKALTISAPQVKTPSGFGRSDGSISINIDGGTAFATGDRYTVVWKDSLGTIIPRANTLVNGLFVSTITGLSRGTYSVVVTDKNFVNTTTSCYATSSFVVSQPKPLLVSLENTQKDFCHGDNNGILVAHATGGISNALAALPYTYSWYSVNNGVASVIPNQTDSVLSNLPIGSYQVKVQDISNPINEVTSAPFTITQPPLLVTTPTTRNISCFNDNDGFIHIAVTGGVGGYKLYCKQIGVDNTYLERPINTGNNTFYLDNLVSGKYSIYITDGNGCTAQINGNSTAEIELTQPEKALEIVSTKTTNPSGFGRADGSIVLTLDGGTPNADNSYNVTWKDKNGQVLTGTASFTNGVYTNSLVNAADGNYTVAITDKNFAGALNTATSCMLNEVYTLVQPKPLLTSIEENHYISCNGTSDGRLIAHATGGMRNPAQGKPYKYTWYNQVGGVYTVMANETDSVLDGLPTGMYQVKIEDYSRTVNTVSQSYKLGQPALLVATATNKLITCGQTINVSATVTGGTQPYTYQWNTGETTQTLPNRGPGKYLVYVTDAHGCTTTALSKITTPSSLDVTGTTFDPICYQSSNGSINLSVTGGRTPYTYLWSNGATTANLDNVKAGTYRVTATDRDGCSFSTGFTLTDPSPLQVDLGADRTICNAQSLTLAPKVVDPKTSFNWTSSNGFKSTAPSVTLSKAGTYKLTITDSKGCQASGQMNLSVKNVDISSDMVVASQVFVNDTVMIVNISTPEPDSIQWLIPQTDSIQVVERAPHYAKVIFTHLGNYVLGMRSHVGDCFQDLMKTIIVTNTNDNPVDPYGESIIKKFYIYPNPNSGEFKVYVELNKISAIRLRLINLGTGALVDDRRLDGKDSYVSPYNLFIEQEIMYSSLKRHREE